MGKETRPAPNEALDLSVYALALVIAVLAAEKVADWSNPPAWASADPDRNPFTARDPNRPSRTARRYRAPAAAERPHRRVKKPRSFDGWSGYG